MPCLSTTLKGNQMRTKDYELRSSPQNMMQEEHSARDHGNLFGHIHRMKDNKLVKEVMFGMLEGQTRRGRS